MTLNRSASSPVLCSPALRSSSRCASCRRLSSGAFPRSRPLVRVAALALHNVEGDRFDEVENVFSEHRAAFAEAVDWVAGLRADQPDAMRIAWRSDRVCVTGSAGRGGCDDASSEQRAVFEQPSGELNKVVWQAKDGGRVFSTFFNIKDPPYRYLM